MDTQGDALEFVSISPPMLRWSLQIPRMKAAQPFEIFFSTNNTCCLTMGSNLVISSLPGDVRLFFVVVYEYPVPAVETS